MTKRAAWLTLVLLASLSAAAVLVSCQVDSFYDPSKTGSAAMAMGYTQPSAAGRAAAPSGLMSALDEELWVVVKPDKAAAPGVPYERGPVASSTRVSPPPTPMPDPSETPGCGAMICRTPAPDDSTKTIDVPLPLRHTDVKASISAYIASVHVTQEFYNPFQSKIEAVYLFPLPDDAAVTGFVMTIGERHIRGIVREREEAQRIYNQARSQGHVASLLTQDRPNVFTQSVANIEPDRQIDVQITYFHTLSYDDGWYEFVFPMVIGPRFNPPGMTGGIGATARNTPGSSGQRTEVQYLRPHERSGHDIGLSVDIEAGVPVDEVVCRSHRTQITNEGSSRVRVALRDSDSVPNRDFVLRYRVAGDKVRTAMLVQRNSRTGENGGHLSLMLYPPREPDKAWRSPMEMIFVVDRSGSMKGQPIEQAKAALDHALAQLQPQDSFNIVEFSDAASLYQPQPVQATSQAVRAARQYVRNMQTGGGTMMLQGMTAALSLPHDPERLRVVAFLTDGFIGNETEVLREMKRRLDYSRVFSFGVGSAPNRYLMNAMARLSQGAVAYLGPNDDGGEVMDRYFDCVSRPVLSDIRIDWGGAQVRDALPSRMPDLIHGRPVVVVARYDGQPPREVRITGRSGRQIVTTTIRVDDDNGGASDALAVVWARRRIAEVADEMIVHPDDPELPRLMTSIALRHGLMSQYTAFIAVDSSTRTAGSYGTTVNVGVLVPDGVKYETTVPE